MSEPIDLLPEIEQVADFLSKRRPKVRELFRYTLVLAMIDDEMRGPQASVSTTTLLFIFLSERMVSGTTLGAVK